MHVVTKKNNRERFEQGQSAPNHIVTKKILNYINNAHLHLLPVVMHQIEILPIF